MPQITGSISPESKIGQKLKLESSISATAVYDFGGDAYLNGNENPTDADYDAALQQAIAKFGSKVVYSQFEDQAIVSGQARARDCAVQVYASKMSESGVQGYFDSWKLGSVARRSSNPEAKKEKAKKQLLSLNVADRQSLLKELQDAIQAELEAGRS